MYPADPAPHMDPNDRELETGVPGQTPLYPLGKCGGSIFVIHHKVKMMS